MRKSLINRWYLIYETSFTVVSLIIQTGTYQPESRHAVLLLVFNRSACLLEQDVPCCREGDNRTGHDSRNKVYSKTKYLGGYKET